MPPRAGCPQGCLARIVNRRGTPMSGRDFGRGGRGGDRDRDRGRGGFRDRSDRGDRGDRGERGDRGDRGPGLGGPRPWERRDDDRPARPFGDRPFDRPRREDRDDEIRVERYYDESPRPRRDDRGDRGDRGDRPRRFSDDREGRGDRDRGRDFAGPPRGGRGDTPWRESGPGPDARPGGAGAQAGPRHPSPEPHAGADERAYQGVSAPPGSSAVAGPGAVGTNRAWTYQHLTDSWQEEERLRGWTPSDQDLQEMVEDNIEADPQLNARDRRNIQVRAAGGVVTLTGTVRSRLAKYAAGSDAYWTYGVQEVRNELDVRVRGPQGAQGAQAEGEARTAAPTGPAATTPPAAAAMSGPDAAAPAASATGGATTGTDTVTAEELAPTPKRATRRRAAATATTEAAGGVEAPAPTRPSADTVDVGGDEALNPPATGGDSADSGEPGFMPPLESPEPNVAVEGRVEPPAIRGAG